MKIIDGRKIKEEILEEIKEEVKNLDFVPMCCDVLIGDDPVSASYVRIKSKTAEAVGFKFRTVEFPSSASTEEIVKEIENLNKVPHMCGIIVQLPFPEYIERQKVLDAIDPSLDVDCLTTESVDKFYNNLDVLSYPTALSCLYILDSLNLDLSDKKIVVLGQGTLVGRPVAHLLKERGLSIKSVNRKSDDTLELLKQADVVISATGKGKFITKGMLKDGVVVIDAGTSEENGSVVGDVDFDSVQEVASYITPSPGGVGPVTVAMLLKNVLQVAKNKK